MLPEKLKYAPQNTFTFITHQNIQVRWKLKLGTGYCFKYKNKLFECVKDHKTNKYDIEEVDPYDQQKFIRFENTTPDPPLKGGDILLFGDDNWFCVHGSSRIVSMLKYAAIYENNKHKTKGFQFLIGP